MPYTQQSNDEILPVSLRAEETEVSRVLAEAVPNGCRPFLAVLFLLRQIRETPGAKLQTQAEGFAIQGDTRVLMGVGYEHCGRARN